MFEENKILCRLCLSSCGCYIDIFDRKGTNGLLVWKILKELLQLEVSKEDGLPVTICEGCVAKVTEFKYFKTMCINSRIEFLKVMANQGIIPDGEGPGLPFPKIALGPRESVSSPYTPLMPEIPDDRDPLEFLIKVDETEMSDAGRKKSSSFAIEVPEECDNLQVKVEDSPEVIELEDSDDEMAEQEEEEEDDKEEGVRDVDASVDSTVAAEVKPSIERYVCHHKECGKSFGSVRGLRMHAQHWHEPDKGGDLGLSWGCPFCAFRVGSRKMLAAHVRAQHQRKAGGSHSKGSKCKTGAKLSVVKRERLVPEVKRSPTANHGVLPDFKLSDKSVSSSGSIAGSGDVKLSAGNLASWQQQNPSHHAKKQAAKSIASSKVIGSNSRQVTCSLCWNKFHNQRSLSLHKYQAHGSQKRHFCQKCMKTFKSEYQYRQHSEKHKSNNELTYRCWRCHSSYPSSSDVKQHCRERHEVEDPVVCDVCWCAFQSEKSLRQHLCRLFGNVFTCPRCMRVFNHRGNLHQHLRKCDGKEGAEKKRKKKVVRE